MNAKTLEAIKNHGKNLLKLFPRAAERDPVTLCKKLRRIETGLAAPILRNCNEGMPEAELDAITDRAEARAAVLLGMSKAQRAALHVNRDPRGYALKMSSEWAAGRTIYKDWGGYGILAPDLTVN